MMTTLGSGSAPGTLSGAADRLDIFPFTARADTAVVGLSVNVTGAVAGAVGKIVMYDSDANGRPNALILETGDLDFSSTGIKTAVIAQTLLQGATYWFGIRHSSTAVLSAWPTSATPDINGGTPSTNACKILRRAFTYSSAAPSTWGWTSSDLNSNAATAIWMKA